MTNPGDREDNEGKKFDEVGSEIVVKTITLDSSGNQVKMVRSRENLAGSSGTGSSGDSDRIYTLTTTSSVDIVEVFLSGVLLIETTNYTIDNSNKQITFVSTAVLNSHTVTIFYNV